MNDVRTKKNRIYNFVSGPVRPTPPLARAGCGLRAYAGRAIAGQRVQHPNPPRVFLCGPASQPA